MAKLKNLKFYTHHFTAFPLEVKSAQATKDGVKLPNKAFDLFFHIGLKLIKLLASFANAIYVVCFTAGFTILAVLKLVNKKIQTDTVETSALLKKRYLIAVSPQFAYALGIFLCFCLLAYAGLQSGKLISKAVEIKGRVLGISLQGSQHLLQAQDAVNSQDFNLAQVEFSRAIYNFQNGQAELEKAGGIINNLLNFLPQKKAADTLLKAGQQISKAGSELVNFYKNFQNVTLTPQGLSLDRPATEIFDNLGSFLQSATSEINSANTGLAFVSVADIPESYRENFFEAKGKVFALQKSLANLNEIFPVARQILTGKKQILLLFENNNELRATGGFMGTYGSMYLQDGKINKLTISSIYDLDGQLNESISPPFPVLNVNDRWYLRDSNWFADFPQSAKKIVSFYEKEGGETPNLVIIMTPQLIVDLLKILGPINVPTFNLTLNSDNFVEQTQVVSSSSANLPINAPKQVLADFAPIFLQKLTGSTKDQAQQILQAIQNNLNHKQIALYSPDSDLQQSFANFHWDGSVVGTDRDYLSIVDSNLGGTKTDLYIDQSATLNSTLDSQGGITNELTITRTNRLPKSKSGFNKNFLRIYVPLGSQLISSSGFDLQEANLQKNNSYKTDDDVYNWEKNSVKDLVTGTVIGQEAGKTFFGNWQQLEGSETKTIKLVYRLPFTLSGIDRQSLLVQKQIGAQDLKLSYTFNFSGKKIDWENFDANKLETNLISTDILLNKDTFLGMVLEDR